MIFPLLFIIFSKDCFSTEVITNCTFEEDRVCKITTSIENSLDHSIYPWKVVDCTCPHSPEQREVPDCTDKYDHTYGNSSGHFVSRQIGDDENDGPRLFLKSLQGGGTINMTFWYFMSTSRSVIKVSSGHNAKNYTCTDPCSDWEEGVFISSVKNTEVISITSYSENRTEIRIDDIMVNLTRPEEERPIKEVQKDIEKVLTVPERKTNHFQMKKKSADDVRPSSRAIGSILGIGILLAMVSFIVVPDIPKLIYDVKHGVEFEGLKKKKQEQKTESRGSSRCDKRQKRLSAIEECDDQF